MLRLLNERAYENGDGTVRSCPLQLAIGASNEWPDDSGGGKELCALLDRFILRKKVRPVSPQAGRKELLKRATLGNDCRPVFTDTITIGEIQEAQQEAAMLHWTNGAKIALWQILTELAKEGINPGDRRIYKSVGVARAYAYLQGASSVQPMHLEILAHVLWDDPAEQPEKCGRIVGRIANPSSAIVTDLFIQMEDILQNTPPTEAVPKLQQIQKQLEGLGADDEATSEKIDTALEYVRGAIKEAYDKVIGFQATDTISDNTSDNLADEVIKAASNTYRGRRRY